MTLVVLIIHLISAALFLTSSIVNSRSSEKIRESFRDGINVSSGALLQKKRSDRMMKITFAVCVIATFLIVGTIEANSM